MRIPVLAALLSIALCAPTAAQVRVTSLADNVLLLQTARGNLVASVGPEGAALVGEVDTITSAAIADSLSARTRSPRRYVLAMSGLASAGQADAGWDARGALVIMQEIAVRGMRRPTSPGLRRPRVQFSQFFSLELNGEDMHAVRQEPGHARSDVLVHFENTNIIYLGESYPGDGYPSIDASLGGTVQGLLKTLEPWIQNTSSKFVGARGAVATGADVRAFHDMVKAVSERVRQMKEGNRSLEQVIAAKPTAAFDERWGRGVISAEAFIRDLYQSKN
jgi:cyclase